EQAAPVGRHHHPLARIGPDRARAGVDALDVGQIEVLGAVSGHEHAAVDRDLVRGALAHAAPDRVGRHGPGRPPVVERRDAGRALRALGPLGPHRAHRAGRTGFAALALGALRTHGTHRAGVALRTHRTGFTLRTHR